MIAVDTNVLARLFVTDNEQQHAAAVRFFSARSTADRAFVSLVVQAELVWLLAQTLKFPFQRVRDALAAMLSSSDFEIEQREFLEAAVDAMSAKQLDLADFLIAGMANKVGCSATVTFDKAAARHSPGMELLK